MDELENEIFNSALKTIVDICNKLENKTYKHKNVKEKGNIKNRPRHNTTNIGKNKRCRKTNKLTSVRIGDQQNIIAKKNGIKKKKNDNIKKSKKVKTKQTDV